MSTKLLFATLIGSVVYFLLGSTIFDFLLESYYSSNRVPVKGLYRGEETRELGILFSSFTQCLLMAYVFDKWANIRTLGTGFAGGMIISGLSTLSFDLMQWSQLNFAPYRLYVVDVLAFTMIGGLSGAVIAYALGRWRER